MHSERDGVAAAPGPGRETPSWSARTAPGPESRAAAGKPKTHPGTGASPATRRAPPPAPVLTFRRTETVFAAQGHGSRVEEATEAGWGPEDLAGAFAALGNPLRVAILARLARPAFVPDLAREFRLTRQALKKHLDTLEAVGLVMAEPGRRGIFAADEYRANPQGLFVFKCAVLALASPPEPHLARPHLTLPAAPAPRTKGAHPGPGLLLVHGDAPGRWFPLEGSESWTLGRDARNEIALPYDAFASARHALLARATGTWQLTDLHATNGTLVNLRPLLPGSTSPVQPGDLLTIGRSHLLLRDAGV